MVGRQVQLEQCVGGDRVCDRRHNSGRHIVFYFCFYRCLHCRRDLERTINYSLHTKHISSESKGRANARPFFLYTQHREGDAFIEAAGEPRQLHGLHRSRLQRQ